jgi:transposase InsO family protein
VIEDWRRDYNEVMPLSSLGDLTPKEFIIAKWTEEQEELAAVA